MNSSLAAPTGIGQIHITVADLAASLAFYCDQLGLPLLFEVPGQGMAFVQCGAVRLYLGRSESPEFRSRPVLYLTVDDIDASYTAMLGRGVPFVEAPHVVHDNGTTQLWIAFARDPDGNHIAIMQERAIAVSI